MALFMPFYSIFHIPESFKVVFPSFQHFHVNCQHSTCSILYHSNLLHILCSSISLLRYPVHHVDAFIIVLWMFSLVSLFACAAATLAFSLAPFYLLLLFSSLYMCFSFQASSFSLLLLVLGHCTTIFPYLPTSSLHFSCSR